MTNPYELDAMAEAINSEQGLFCEILRSLGVVRMYINPRVPHLLYTVEEAMKGLRAVRKCGDGFRDSQKSEVFAENAKHSCPVDILPSGLPGINITDLDDLARVGGAEGNPEYTTAEWVCDQIRAEARYYELTVEPGRVYIGENSWITFEMIDWPVFISKYPTGERWAITPYDIPRVNSMICRSLPSVVKEAL